jgi:hypothetical protein
MHGKAKRLFNRLPLSIENYRRYFSHFCESLPLAAIALVRTRITDSPWNAMVLVWRFRPSDKLHRDPASSWFDFLRYFIRFYNTSIIKHLSRIHDSKQNQ